MTQRRPDWPDEAELTRRFLAMGFEPADVRRAIRAASGDPNLAAELLVDPIAMAASVTGAAPLIPPRPRARPREVVDASSGLKRPTNALDVLFSKLDARPGSSRDSVEEVPPSSRDHAADVQRRADDEFEDAFIEASGVGAVGFEEMKSLVQRGEMVQVGRILGDVARDNPAAAELISQNPTRLCEILSGSRGRRRTPDADVRVAFVPFPQSYSSSKEVSTAVAPEAQTGSAALVDPHSPASAAPPAAAAVTAAAQQRPHGGFWRTAASPARRAEQVKQQRIETLQDVALLREKLREEQARRRSAGDLTADDMAAIARLVSLGFGRDEATQAYLASGKDELVAANKLFGDSEGS